MRNARSTAEWTGAVTGVLFTWCSRVLRVSQPALTRLLLINSSALPALSAYRLRQPTIINDESQGSIAKHLSCDGLRHYKVMTKFTSENIFFKSAGEVTCKMVDHVIRRIRLALLSSRLQNSPDD